MCSGGCTAKEAFDVFTNRAECIVKIWFQRKELDHCLARFPYGAWLQFSFSDLGIQAGESFVVINPLAPFIVPED